MTAPAASSPPVLPRSPGSSVFVTVLGWLLIIAGGLLLPISALSLLMVLVGSDGTANASWSGGLVVIGGPAATLISGVGLWRRRIWGYGGTLLLLVATMVWNLVIILRGPTPTQTYISPAGVPTAVTGSEVNYVFHILVIAIVAVVVAMLWQRRIRYEFGARSA